MTEIEKRAPTLADLRARRDDILRLAAQHKAYNVRVFGSVARGDSTPESDVDLMVSFQDGASIYEMSGLWQDLEALLGCKVDVASDDVHPRRERFMQRIAKDVVPL
jgi:hypothetical protein